MNVAQNPYNVSVLKDVLTKLHVKHTNTSLSNMIYRFTIKMVTRNKAGFQSTMTVFFFYVSKRVCLRHFYFVDSIDILSSSV